MQRGSVPVGRFHIDLDVIKEECAAQFFVGVQEKNVEYLNDEHSASFYFSNLCDDYAKEDGFPEVLDLSNYLSANLDDEISGSPESGLSIFAKEFDRLAGKISESESLIPKRIDPDLFNDIDEENQRRIKALTDEEIRKARREIYERFDDKTVKFLLSRGRKSTDGKNKEKVSYFKKTRFQTSTAVDNKEAVELHVQEKIKEMEVFSTDNDRLRPNISSSFSIDDTPHARLAADAVYLDFMAKCSKSLIPRKQQNILRLFDSLEKEPNGDDDLLKTAQSNLPTIKGLFLEERRNSKGIPAYEFATDINPLEQSCWTLCPIRKVLDVCAKDGKVATEDVVIVRLSLLWTVLLMSKRISLFQAFTSPSDTYVRLAEVFLIGPDIFMDECVRRCTDRVFRRYIIPKSMDRLLSLKLTDPIANLDAFLPFYEDLLKHYEEDGMGDELFSLFLLVGAYMNSSLKDGLFMKCAIWTPQRHLIRMIIVGCKEGDFLLKFLAETRKDDAEELETDLYAQYSHLLAMYVKAIREETVTRERNPLVFEIAASDLGNFIRRHEERIKLFSGKSPHWLKELDAFVDILRHSLVGKLEL